MAVRRACPLRDRRRGHSVARHSITPSCASSRHVRMTAVSWVLACCDVAWDEASSGVERARSERSSRLVAEYPLDIRLIPRVQEVPLR